MAKRPSMGSRDRTPTGKEGLFGSEAAQVAVPTADNQMNSGQLRERLEREYETRSFVSMTTFVEPSTKASLAVIQPFALSITGSKRYTESAILRVLAELVVDLQIDWAEELKLAPEGIPPRDMIRWVLRKHLPNLALTPQELADGPTSSEE